MAAVLAAAALVCGALALLTLPRPSSFEYIRRPVSQASLTVRDSGISGTLRDLPPYRLHWDGQPPRAFLTHDRTNRVVGAPVLSAATLQLNHDAVLWTPDGASFVISPSVYAANRDHLAITFEVPPPRAAFYWFALLTVVLASGALVLLCGHRLLFVRPGGTVDSVFGYVQIVLFVAAAFAAALTQFPGFPLTGHQGTDEPNINSFAAALDRPDVFQHDKLLSERSNFDWYTPLYVQWVRLWKWSGFHYDTNRSAIILLSTLIALCGYQRLCGTLSGSATLGFVAAVCLWFVRRPYPPNEVWAATLAAPRTAYSALFPWVLLLAFSVRERPNRWWLAAAASGLLFYVHPASSPALTGAILMGFLLAGAGTWRTRIWHAGIAAAAVVAVMAPYIAIYASKYSRTIVPDAEVAKKVVLYATQRYAPGYLDISTYAAQLSTFVMQNRRYWLGAAAIILLIPFLRRSGSARFLLGALAGFCVVTFGIPFVDLTMAKRAGRLPFQVDLIRNLRYVDVFLVSVIAIAVGEYRAGWRRRAVEEQRADSMPVGWSSAVVFAGILVVLYCYGELLYPTALRIAAADQQTVRVLNGRPGFGVTSTIELVNALQALRHDEETVLGNFVLRQMNIPMTYGQKDLGALSYANPYGLVRAREVLDSVAPLLRPPITLEEATAIGSAMDADVLVLRSTALDPTALASSAVIFRTKDQAVLRIAANGGE